MTIDWSRFQPDTFLQGSFLLFFLTLELKQDVCILQSSLETVGLLQGPRDGPVLATFREFRAAAQWLPGIFHRSSCGPPCAIIRIGGKASRVFEHGIYECEGFILSKPVTVTKSWRRPAGLQDTQFPCRHSRH